VNYAAVHMLDCDVDVLCVMYDELQLINHHSTPADSYHLSTSLIIVCYCCLSVTTLVHERHHVDTLNIL